MLHEITEKKLTIIMESYKKSIEIVKENIDNLHKDREKEYEIWAKNNFQKLYVIFIQKANKGYSSISINELYNKIKIPHINCIETCLKYDILKGCNLINKQLISWRTENINVLEEEVYKYEKIYKKDLENYKELIKQNTITLSIIEEEYEEDYEDDDSLFLTSDDDLNLN